MQLKNFFPYIGLICLLFLLIGCELPPSINPESQSSTPTSEQENTKIAVVDRVVDGDTIQVIMNGEEESVRLLLVDTPETKHPNLPKQPYGEQASEFATKMLANQTITLEFDGPRRDKYNRLLAYIWVDDTLFNESLLANGLARYAYEYDPPYLHQRRLKQAEISAEDSQLGIWSLTNYVSEQGFNQLDSESEINSTLDTVNNHTYKTCSDVRMANKAPLYQGDKGYSSKLDRDGDGIACK